MVAVLIDSYGKVVYQFELFLYWCFNDISGLIAADTSIVNILGVYVGGVTY